jgi:type II restriction enzyme
MNLQCDLLLGSRYKSGAQQSRVISERWCLNALYCPACPSPQLKDTKANTKGIDFLCDKCEARYQLKSAKTKLGKKILDSAYSVMVAAIESGRMPHLLALRYDASWRVSTLLLIPSFFFTASAIQRRNPLSPTAQRAGYVGCNILLDHIPASGRIPIIESGCATPQAKVRSAFKSLQDLNDVKPGREARGWTLDVLRVVESLGQKAFSLDDVYKFERELERLHPGNKNVRPKIRQQLQVLRDMHRLRFVTPGHYELS